MPFYKAIKFQSTLPTRGATLCPLQTLFQQHDFNPRSPRGERPGTGTSETIIRNFNPRSPRGERLWSAEAEYTLTLFQSTLPTRGATFLEPDFPITKTISIHAPHAGSDRYVGNLARYISISIHAPHAGSDGDCVICFCCLNISIHAPHAGSDSNIPFVASAIFYFNPRSPRGERLAPLGAFR